MLHGLLLLGLIGPVSGTLEKRVDDIAKALGDVAEARRACKQLEAKYRDGNGLDGWTHVAVGLGGVQVKRTRPGKPDELYEGPLQDAECRAMAKNAVAGKLWTVKSKRDYGVPDETEPEITMGVAGIGSFKVSLWDNDADDVPAFAAARRQLVAIAKRVSGGKVAY